MEEENPYENQVEFALRYGELDEIPGQKSYRKLISIAAVASVIIVGILSIFLVIRANNIVIISFNSNGGASVGDIEIDKGSSVSLPTATRSGYIFEGWYRNGTKIGADTVFTENTTLIARWIAEGVDTFEIAFDSNGGSKVESLRMECGKELILPENPTRDGYSFVVWSDQNEVPILDGALLACKDIQLTASWTKGDVADKIGPESITLDQKTVDLNVGDTGLLIATLKPIDTENKSIAWTSSDPEIVSVDPSGLLTARKVGEVIITATAVNGKTASAVVYSDIETVTLKASSKLEYLSNYGNLDVQKSIVLTVMTDSPIDLEEEEFIWESTNTSGVASPATLEAEGDTATLTANNLGGNDVEEVTVTVSVGRTHSKTLTFYIEPQLTLSGDATVVTNNELTIVSSTDVSEWSVRAKEGATKMTIQTISRGDRKMVVKPVLNDRDPNTHQEILSSDLVITAITRSGQKVDMTVQCLKK